jgi:hypothetical protein
MSKKQNTKNKNIFTNEDLEDLIEEATVDAYDEYEQRIGFLTMIQDNVSVPFEATLNDESVTVSEIDGNDRTIKAIIKHSNKSFPVDILDLKIDYSFVKGSEWIAAYRKWEGQ